MVRFLFFDNSIPTALRRRYPLRRRGRDAFVLVRQRGDALHGRELYAI